MPVKGSGFSLLELLITITIVGILAAIAIPNYSRYVQKSRRSEAFNALHQTVNAMEKYKLSKNAYPDDIDTLDGTIKSHGLVKRGSYWESVEGNYRFTIQQGVGGVDRRVRAVAQGNQLKDATCSTLRLFVDGRKSASAPDATDTSTSCWPS